MEINPGLLVTIGKLTREADRIPEERRSVLRELSGFVRQRQSESRKTLLSFICTHNSRRSHIAQLWANAAAGYYSLTNIECYSGGTEATAFDSRAVRALMEAGFDIAMTLKARNPIYRVSYSPASAAIISFSKKYDDPFNPSHDFAAILTCSHADENCPVVRGAVKRIVLPYDDPKQFDGTPLEREKYAECVEQIGREVLFAFSVVRP